MSSLDEKTSLTPFVQGDPSQEPQIIFQQKINEVLAWKQMEHLLILSCTKVYKSVFC